MVRRDRFGSCWKCRSEMSVSIWAEEVNAAFRDKSLFLNAMRMLCGYNVFILLELSQDCPRVARESLLRG